MLRFDNWILGQLSINIYKHFFAQKLKL